MAVVVMVVVGTIGGAYLWLARANSLFPLQIAHECGGIINTHINPATGQQYGWETYTSSLEAFNQSLAGGYYMFEVDLVLLADGGILAAHDAQESHYKGTNGQKFYQITNRWQVTGGYDGLTLLRGQDIVNLAIQNPHIRIVLDAKKQSGAPADDRDSIVQIIAGLAKRAGHPEVLWRIVPHVRDAASTQLYRTWGYHSVILALYEDSQYLTDAQVVQLMQQQKIPAVMMWSGTFDPSLSVKANAALHQRYSWQFAQSLKNAGFQLYVYNNGSYPADPAHSVDSPSIVSGFMSKSVGVYSNIDHQTESYTP